MNEKKTYIIWGAGILALILLTSSKIASSASNVFNSLLTTFSATQIDYLTQAYNALINAGFAGVSLKLALSEVLFETGAFTASSQVAFADNNLTGIEWINNPDEQVNATQGTPMPGGGYFAHFLTLQDWANDYKRIVNLPPYYPIEYAGDPNTFANLLSENGYYTGSSANYSAGLTKYFNILNPINLP